MTVTVHTVTHMMTKNFDQILNGAAAYQCGGSFYYLYDLQRLLVLDIFLTVC